MQKILLISFIVAPIVIGMVAARDVSPVRGVRRALTYWIGFNVVYLLLYRFVYPRLF